MPTAIRTEYAELDGLPLSTAAWDTNSLLGLWDIPEIRGDDPAVPYRRGSLPFRRLEGPKYVTLPITIYGDLDSDGDPHPDPREGLLINIDELKAAILGQPRILTADGNRTLRYHLPDGTVRAAGAQLIGPLGLTPIGPTAVRGALDLIIPDGVLRSETLTTITSGVASGGGFADVVVPNPGTAYQDRAVFTLTGTFGSSVKITNQTLGSDHWLQFGGGSGTAGVVINSGAWTAVRDTINVIGLISHSGFESWLPLIPGNNTLRIEPVGGNATLKVDHYAAFL